MVTPQLARFNPNREFSKYQKFLQKSGYFRDKLTLRRNGKIHLTSNWLKV